MKCVKYLLKWGSIWCDNQLHRVGFISKLINSKCSQTVGLQVCNFKG
jgi:hypothetical protein